MKVTIFPQKLKGTIGAIPSKSHAHRILIAQKLAHIQSQGAESSVEVPSFSKDIEATKACLKALDSEKPHLNCGESGSTIRFMLPVTMALKDTATFAGSGKLPQRPLSPLKEEMAAHGVAFNIYESTNNSTNSGDNVDICTTKGRLQPGIYRLAGNVSSQFITGLLFALPLLDGDSSLQLTTQLESAGYVDLSLDVLRTFGIIINETLSPSGFINYQIPGNQKYREPSDLRLQGDWSNASFWLACGALGSEITCTNLDINSPQRDKEIIHVLKLMGANITITDDSVTVSPGAKLNPQNVNISQTPDMAPVLAVLMAGAYGTSSMTDAARLKIKESDRLSAIFDTITGLGGRITIGDDYATINGSGWLEGGTVNSFNDHRIAMAAATASCICRKPVIIEDAQAVTKSYPNFYEDFASLGGHIIKE
ncbi:MAG: 3-phosphoshikimate 1-carboxyvinyltransferase [Bacillota bacterium]|nr:3-phosphoshikimate 1-carboxyvinyltransferase [Bacillota bacterium]